MKSRRMWAIDLETGIAHAFKSIAAYRDGKAPFCGATVHHSKRVRRGELLKVTRCPECVNAIPKAVRAGVAGHITPSARRRVAKIRKRMDESPGKG